VHNVEVMSDEFNVDKICNKFFQKDNNDFNSNNDDNNCDIFTIASI
jgi:hypothetical protein